MDTLCADKIIKLKVEIFDLIREEEQLKMKFDQLDQIRKKKVGELEELLKEKKPER